MRRFLNLVDYICAKNIFERKVVFLGETAKNWFVINKTLIERSQPYLLCSYLFNKFTNPMSARQVVQSICSLVVELR